MAAADVQHQPTWKGLKATADAAFKAGHYSRAAESYSEILSGWVDSQAAVDASVKLKVLSNRALAYQKAGELLSRRRLEVSRVQPVCKLGQHAKLF